VIDKFGLDGLAPGDIILTNDPYTGSGTHLSDVNAVMPIFYQGKIVAFAANKGHWNEIGGKALGSWGTDTTEIYQEGMQFPIIKVYEQGHLNVAVRDMIAANCRTPAMTLGDLYAQTASLRIGERRVLELCEKYGVEAVLESVAHILENGERQARQELARLPKGVFEAEDYLDTKSRGIEHVKGKVKITITDDEFIVDLTGSGPQMAAPVNCSAIGALAGVRVAYHAILNPHAHPCEGFYRPLKFIAPPRTVFTCERPAPCSCHWEPIGFLSDLVWKALAPAVPERVSAGHFLSIIGTILGGIEDESDQPYILCEPQAGGWGACHDRDGVSGMVSISDGETFIIPVEVAEMKYPILVEQYSFHLASGAGKFRGGYGLIRDYRLLNSNGELTTIVSRHDTLPWPMMGGEPGSPNVVEVHHADGRKVVGSTYSQYALRRGDLVRLITGGGAGYGDPLERDPLLVAADVRDGVIDADTAREKYGVVVDPATWEVDEAATASWRRTMREKRGQRPR
ncbi:MAG TPA: hydantoinase B/oxoprolinase family protein, partial [Firmicutes bacterium]|nr:hydantoinase B/oxoprolinase family protein [Bacillota bacterium]